jgi:hypothetical protein
VSIRRIAVGAISPTKLSAQKADYVLALKELQEFFELVRPCYLRLAVHNQNDLAALTCGARGVAPGPGPYLTAQGKGQDAAAKGRQSPRVPLSQVASEKLDESVASRCYLTCCDRGRHRCRL